MKSIIFIFLILLYTVNIKSQNDSTKQNTETKTNMNKNIYDITVKTMDGSDKSLADYKGNVLLIVNVASRCGNTPQYKGLENLYITYKDKGLIILGFPCNDFGRQEPGTNDEIKQFCEMNYKITFPLFDKIKVLGADKSLLYERLTHNSEPTGDVQWNFEKFLIDKNGNIIKRFGDEVKPESKEVVDAITKELNN